MDERAMHQWWVLTDEKTRRDLVAGEKDCYSYGAVKMLQQLPAAVQAKVRTAYAAHLEDVARLEALYPAG